MPLVLSIIFFLLLPSCGNSDQIYYEFCQPKICSPKGPNIRFPFRLKTQPIFCGLEGFELTCLNNKTLLLHLPFSGYYHVQEISYIHRTITIVDLRETTCLIKSLFSLNLTNSRFYNSYPGSCSIVNCTKRLSGKYYQLVGPIDCISDDGNFVYVTSAYESMDILPPTYCVADRIVNYSWDQLNSITTASNTPIILIVWKALDGCYECEKSRNYCGFNVTSNSTICVKCPHANSHGPVVKILASTAASIGGIIFFALVILLIYKSRKSENEKETQIKVEKFLEDYKTLNPTRYTYNDLKKITGKFRHRLGQGGYGSVFRGKLSNGIPVAVKMLEHSKGNGEEFINEVATIGRIHHFNIVRLLGFYSEGTRRALIYEFMPNGSLEKFIFSKTDKSTRSLSWEKLQNIATGVARGIEYLHLGCSQRILHFDIKPHNILLDHNFQPKISDFGLAKLCSKEQSIVSMTAARGTAGYIAPELFSRNFGEVSYKSDVFSYGMMLLEMVGCRKNIDVTVDNQSQIYFPEWIYDKMSRGKELSLEVEEDGDEEIAKKLTIVALCCIQWNPTDRPSITMVIQMLEGDLQSLEIPPKPFVSSDVEMGAN